MIPQTSANDASNGWPMRNDSKFIQFIHLYDAQEWLVILINGAIIICQILHPLGHFKFIFDSVFYCDQRSIL